MGLLLGVHDLARLALHREPDRFGHDEALGLKRYGYERLERFDAAAIVRPKRAGGGG
jgi:hypothetical protein